MYIKIIKMKKLHLLISLLLIVMFNISAAAQTHDHSKMNTSSTKTESFKVWGKCDMCKERIESTVKTAGATTADWDTKTHILKATFDPSKVTVDGLSKKLAAVGHDTEKYKATEEAYSKLPGCCHYDRN
jgi:periplasmic mercuric ion binding protein